MIETIKGLLQDERLDYLARTPEFKQVRGRLLYMQEHPDLTDEQVFFIGRISAHIKNIHPHIKVITVNGEDVPVEFVTDFHEQKGYE